MMKTHNKYLNSKRLKILKFAKLIIAEEGLNLDTFQTIASKHNLNINEINLLFPDGNKDLNGKNITGEAEGLHARVIQHEFDHLNGILYISRLAHKNAFGYSEEIEKFWKKHNDENSQ